jgi:hypothetical protein
VVVGGAGGVDRTSGGVGVMGLLSRHHAVQWVLRSSFAVRVEAEAVGTARAPVGAGDGQKGWRQHPWAAEIEATPSP